MLLAAPSREAPLGDTRGPRACHAGLLNPPEWRLLPPPARPPSPSCCPADVSRAPAGAAAAPSPRPPDRREAPPVPHPAPPPEHSGSRGGRSRVAVGRWEPRLAAEDGNVLKRLCLGNQHLVFAATRRAAGPAESHIFGSFVLFAAPGMS